MNRKLSALCATSICATLCANPARADQVEIYGLIDAGLTRYSDAADAAGRGTGPLTKMDTGVANANRIGFRGIERLGDGINAFFTLETGYNLDDGTLGQGGRMFGRQAFVGLANRYGEASVGRHYDFMVNMNAYSTGAATVAGLLAFGLHASPRTSYLMNDRIYAGDRVDNSIKLQSKPLRGWTFGAMYGLGETAGNSRAGRSYSGRIAYDAGPLSAGFALTDLRDATGVYSTRIYGLGARYKFSGSWRAYALATQVENNSGRQLKVDTSELGVTWTAAPLVDLSAGVQKQSRNNDIRSAYQLTLVADYRLSTRTNLYAVAAFLRDRGFAAQTTAAVGVAAADGTQNALRIGMRHLF